MIFLSEGLFMAKHKKSDTKKSGNGSKRYKKSKKLNRLKSPKGKL